jgi:hypothetical protein
MKRRNGEVILGGCLDFKIPAGLSCSAMKGLTRELASSGHPNITCEHQIEVLIDDSIGIPFYFYHIRMGAQEKDFVIGELREMHLRPASMYESTSLASLGFHKLHSAVACIDPKSVLFMDLVRLVCLTTTMVADDLRFHPVLKCKADREMWMERASFGTELPLDALVPVTNHRFDSWKQ